MSDRFVKNVAKILVIVSQPLESCYYRTLEMLSGGWNEQKQWVSDRSIGSWVYVINGILGTLESETLSNRLGLTKPLRITALVTMDDFLPRWTVQETELLKTASSFAICLAECYVWSNMHYWMSIPELLAGLLHSDRRVRKQVLSHAKEIVETLLQAEHVAKNMPRDSLLVSLLNDLAWNKQQLPREAMALLLQSDFEDAVLNSGNYASVIHRFPIYQRLAGECFRFPSQEGCCEQHESEVRRRNEVCI